MSEKLGPLEAPPPEPTGTVTVASRMSAYLRRGGVITPLLTVLLAFLVGGLVVLASGSNPLSTSRAIFDGSGLNWLFPWISADDRIIAAQNLQQTLIITTPLILTGLAVAYAFRAGLFNIGGQGQYIVGTIAAVYVGTRLESAPAFLHVLACVVAACLAGAVWGGIAGYLKAATGANEVISTIMLNYTALWIGVYLFDLGGPLQNTTEPSIPKSDDILGQARLPVFWGDPELQGLHIGIFIAVAVAVAYWVLVNRSVEGYEVRAVGYNPDAAEYGGIHSGWTYIKVMAVCGLFAGLAGAIDILGWQFRLATNDIRAGYYGFFGIAVALLGRNTALGTCLAALLFGSLISGTSVRNLDPAVFEPQLGEALTFIIQGLVVLFVSAPVLVAMILRRRRAAG